MKDMATIKIGRFELRDWLLSCGGFFLTRQSIENGTFCEHIVELVNRSDGLWYPKFYGDLYILQSIYHGPESFKRTEEAKQYIDEFLIRANKMKAFW